MFNFKNNDDTKKSHKVTLKARAEIIHFINGQVTIPKTELLPGVYLAELLSMGLVEICVTTTINSSEEGVTIDPPEFELEDIENDSFTMIFTAPCM